MKNELFKVQSMTFRSYKKQRFIRALRFSKKRHKSSFIFRYYHTVHFAFKNVLQWKMLIGITSGQRQTGYNNWLIIISKWTWICIWYKRVIWVLSIRILFKPKSFSYCNRAVRKMIFLKLILLNNDYCEAIVLLHNIILFSSIIVFTVCVARNTREQFRHPLKGDMKEISFLRESK
jgi:hypothetical protein